MIIFDSWPKYRKFDAMKIIHTADWHLGHQLYGYERSAEQQSMLAQIADIVESRRPDALLVSGDIFDTTQPSVAAVSMLSACLMDIHRRCPSTRLILTAGNHDAASRHEVNADVWRLANVEMTGTRSADPDRHIIALPGKGYIVAVPYINSRFVPEGFYQGLLDRVAELNTEGLPVVLMAHTAVAGSDSSGHRVADTVIGNIEAMPADALGEGYDYLALGHIHKPQRCGARGRYSGAPMAVGFDEDYAHSVVEVTIDAHGAEPRTELIEIDNPHPLVTLPSGASAGWDEALAMLASFDGSIPAYIRLNVADDGSLPADARGRAVAACEGKACRFCFINLTSRKVAEGGSASLSIEELKEKTPREIAALYLERRGLPFDDELREMLDEVIANVDDNLRQK